MDAYQLLMVVFSGITLLGSGAAVAVGMILKFNDMAHIAKDFEEIKKDVKSIKDDITTIKVNCAAKCR